ncbi:hypothetical protein ABZP36_016334 [Zizania latifolia]
MDSSSWIHGYTNANAAGNNGFMCGYSASCSPAGEYYFQDREQQQQLLVSSQMQHHLNQISMHMSMDDEPAAVYGGAPSNGARSMVDDLLIGSSSAHHAASSFPSSSSSSSFRSPSVSCSPESCVAHVLAVPAAATGFQYPEVSSQAPLCLAPLLPYEAPQHGHYTGLPLTELPATGGGAFRRYARHLGPRRPPKPGACGQRMFKTAMSVLAKMNMAMKCSRQYYYQQAVSAAPPAGNQLQHMISERKRREKLNDSFVALKAVLPPGSKVWYSTRTNKTSILIRAREYVKSLESKLSELEEKNRALEAQLASRTAVAKDEDYETAATDQASEKAQDLVEIEVTSGGAGAAAAEAEAGEESTETCTLNVAVTTPPSRAMSTTDVVLRTLQCLREQIGDGASLVAMSTSAASGGRPPRANLTLQLKEEMRPKSLHETWRRTIVMTMAEARTVATTASLDEYYDRANCTEEEEDGTTVDDAEEKRMTAEGRWEDKAAAKVVAGALPPGPSSDAAALALQRRTIIITSRCCFEEVSSVV